MKVTFLFGPLDGLELDPRALGLPLPPSFSFGPAPSIRFLNRAFGNVPCSPPGSPHVHSYSRAPSNDDPIFVYDLANLTAT